MSKVDRLLLMYDWVCPWCLVGFYSEMIDQSCDCEHPLCNFCGRHLDGGFDFAGRSPTKAKESTKP